MSLCCAARSPLAVFCSPGRLWSCLCPVQVFVLCLWHRCGSTSCVQRGLMCRWLCVYVSLLRSVLCGVCCTYTSCKQFDLRGLPHWCLGGSQLSVFLAAANTGRRASQQRPTVVRSLACLHYKVCLVSSSIWCCHRQCVLSSMLAGCARLGDPARHSLVMAAALHCSVQHSFHQLFASHIET